MLQRPGRRSACSAVRAETLLRGICSKHQLAAADQPPEGSEPLGGLAAIEAQVNEVAAELWGITDKGLKEIRRSSEELR
jgi:hypothetical protein